MAITLTPKENYLRLGRGEMPEYVPNFTMGGMWPPSGTPTRFPPVLFGMAQGVMPFAMPQPGQTEYTDMWGVVFTSDNKATNNQGLPKPGHFILKDVTKWRDVIKRPNVAPANTFDWEKLAKDGTAHINRETTGVMCSIGNGCFQTLINFMGFTEGLCALIEEPEACKELLNWMADFYIPYDIATLDAFKPDIVYFGDDSAAQKDPFFSTAVFRDVFKPIYARYTKAAIERGIPIQLHNCGRCEDWMEDYVEIGIKYWDPAQECNNLVKVKEQFKKRLVVVGGYNFYPDERYNQVTEEYVRESVRKTIDKYAPGGGYAWLGGYLGRADEMDIAAQINTWINEEVDSYGQSFYKK